MILHQYTLLLDEIVTYTIAFAKLHEILAIPLVFFLAFGESLAFISFFLPATIILLALSVLIGESGISFWPIWTAATIGAFLGDWLSYWIGYHYKDNINKLWPLYRYPYLLTHGRIFFARWGMFGLFIGRFFGPIRAVVPLSAGICNMPKGSFQLVNIISAFFWAFIILAPGAFGMKFLHEWID